MKYTTGLKRGRGKHHTCGVMVSVFASIAVDCRFEYELMSGQTKNYKIGICCFSSMYTTLRSKSKDGLAWNQDNVSEWSDMCVHCQATDSCFSELAL